MKLSIFKIAILSIDKLPEIGYTDNDRLLSIENSNLKISEFEKVRKNTMEITLKKKVIVNQEDIDDIMCTALEGGITYWCIGAQSIMENEWMNENNIVYTSDVTGRGGDIVLTTYDGDYVLTLKGFLTGLQMAIDDNTVCIEPIGGEYRIDTGDIDADIADIIVQYALFGELVYA